MNPKIPKVTNAIRLISIALLLFSTPAVMAGRELNGKPTLEGFSLIKSFSAEDKITILPQGEFHIYQGVTIPLKGHQVLRISLAFMSEEDYLNALEIETVKSSLEDLQQLTVLGQNLLPVEIPTTGIHSKIESLPSLAAGTLCSDVIARAVIELGPDLWAGINFHMPMELIEKSNKSVPIVCPPPTADYFGDCPFYWVHCSGYFCTNILWSKVGGDCEPDISVSYCTAEGLFCHCYLG